ncbi:synaptonemal complex protein 3-like [Dipodomys merriami]|uniref:synaptonemal complex protein 3-like n=1 Tax=Dipodomys merriami TaxID=94247 RepID=UPI00385581F2
MEPRARKYPRLAGQVPRRGQQDVTPNQANNPAIHISEDTHTLEEAEESEGTEFQDMFQKLQEDITKLLLTRKNSMKLKVNQSFKNIQKKLDGVLKLQHERRKVVYQKHAREFANFVVTTTTDMEKIKKEAEKLATQFQEQQETFQKYVTAYSKKIASLGNLFQNHFMKLQHQVVLLHPRFYVTCFHDGSKKKQKIFLGGVAEIVLQ